MTAVASTVAQLDLFAPADAAVAAQFASLRPPLKWAGGKTWQVPHVRPIWTRHAHRRFIEPFCGGLGMTLGLRPPAAVINDINAHVVDFYRWLRRGLVIDLPMANDEEMFYAHRARFNALVGAGHSDSDEAAALFYYLNRTCFNGLCRFNRRGEFNVPFGKYTTVTYTRDFSAYADVLGGWTFTSTDFERVHLDADDFLYVDPPYDVEFTEYSDGGFSWGDQQRLARWLGEHSGPVVACNQATPRIVSLYARTGFTIDYFDAPRRISCNGDRRPAREMIATRNLEAAGHAPTPSAR